MSTGSFLKKFVLPWHSQLCPIPTGRPKPYFGPYTSRYGGPDLKARKLKAAFGNHWLNHNILYVLSGKPMDLHFVEKAKKRGSKIILNQDGVYYPAWYKGDSEAQNAILERYHEFADMVFYQSQFCVDTTQLFVDPPKRPFQIVYNAVDTEFLHVPERKAPQGRVRLLAASFFNPSNNYSLSLLFKLVRMLNDQKFDCHLYLAGRMLGGTTPLKKLIQENGVEDYVTYKGEYDLAQFRNLCAESDIFIHLKHNDPCPNAVIEAMSCGLPVVGSASGGVPELVWGCGKTLPVPFSYVKTHLPALDDLVQAVKDVAADHQNYSTSARERARVLFDSKAWFKKHQEVMEELVKSA